MVARITFGKHVEGVLLYNKIKMDKGQAQVLLCHNLPLRPYNGTLSLRTLGEAFLPYLSHPRSRLSQPVFHASLNPHPEDSLDTMQFQQIAHDYMEHMGYGDQPYVVFVHSDIERTHLHIVCSRIQPDGKPVDYYRYKERSMAATQLIEQEYGLHPAVKGEQQQCFEELRKVVYADGELKSRMASVLRNLLSRYRVGSLGEFNTLLRLFNISAQECRGEVGGRLYQGMIYGVLDMSGERAGKPIKASRIGRDVGYVTMQREYVATKRWVTENRRKLEPMCQTIREAMKSTCSQAEFTSVIRRAGLSVIFHRNSDHKGRIYGVTFIDHTNGIVINGSKLDRDFSANHFEKLFNGGVQEQLPIPPNHSPNHVSEHHGHTTESDEHYTPTYANTALTDDLLGALIDEAAQPDQWEEWFKMQKKKRRRSKPKL